MTERVARNNYAALGLRVTARTVGKRNGGQGGCGVLPGIQRGETKVLKGLKAVERVDKIDASL